VLRKHPRRAEGKGKSSQKRHEKARAMRKYWIIPLFLLASTGVFADEIDDLKLDVQKLRERVTDLNNSMRVSEMKNWGNSLAIGIPAGLYNEDFIVGLDFGYTFLKYIVLRVDAHVLIDIHNVTELTLRGVRSVRKYSPVLLPSLSIMGKSPMIFNVRVYGGLSFGITYQIIGNFGPCFQYKALGGVEIFTTKHQAFFLEAGGGGAVFTTRENINYTGGAIVAGGSRFYL
jgi:hypothetical protein